jgi:hypothetical protein
MPAKFWTDEPEDTRSIDQIIKEQARPFKVGDTVIVEKIEAQDTLSAKNYKVGDIFTVHSVEDSNILDSKLWLHDHRGYAIGAGGCRKIDVEGTPVTVHNKYLGMRVKPGKDWGQEPALKALGYYSSKYITGVIDKFFDDKDETADWVRVTWQDERSTIARTGPRVLGYKEGYDLFVAEDD